jgi:hypothetical protein
MLLVSIPTRHIAGAKTCHSLAKKPLPFGTVWFSLQVEGAMRPDRVEVSWDAAKSKWLVRIETGEEVIRRHCDAPKNADDQTLGSAAQKTVEDEGYELDLTSISIRR